MSQDTETSKPLDSFVFCQPSESLNGALRFQSVNSEWLGQARELLDQYNTLSDWTRLKELEDLVRACGVEFKFVDIAEEKYKFLSDLVTVPFEVNSPWFKEGNDLFPFQHIGLNLAESLERVLLQWDTGGGKTLAG